MFKNCNLAFSLLHSYITYKTTALFQTHFSSLCVVILKSINVRFMFIMVFAKMKLFFEALGNYFDF